MLFSVRSSIRKYSQTFKIYFTLSMTSQTDDNIILLVTYFAAVAYNFFDIFMITYFGNEIELSSARLSYCLFESNWIGQSEACKTCIVILAEVLKHPQRLLIYKLYPLNLQTFTAVRFRKVRMELKLTLLFSAFTDFKCYLQNV